MPRKKTTAKPKKSYKPPTKYMALESFHVANIVRAVKGEPVEIKNPELAAKLLKGKLIRNLGSLRG